MSINLTLIELKVCQQIYVIENKYISTPENSSSHFTFTPHLSYNERAESEVTKHDFQYYIVSLLKYIISSQTVNLIERLQIKMLRTSTSIIFRHQQSIAFNLHWYQKSIKNLQTLFSSLSHAFSNSVNKSSKARSKTCLASKSRILVAISSCIIA